jgi:hypothetical protein
MDFYLYSQNKISSQLPPITPYEKIVQPVIEQPKVLTKSKGPLTVYEPDEELSPVENLRNEAVETPKLSIGKMRNITKEMVGYDM